MGGFALETSPPPPPVASEAEDDDNGNASSSGIDEMSTRHSCPLSLMTKMNNFGYESSHT